MLPLDRTSEMGELTSAPAFTIRLFSVLPLVDTVALMKTPWLGYAEFGLMEAAPMKGPTGGETRRTTVLPTFKIAVEAAFTGGTSQTREREPLTVSVPALVKST